VFVLTQRVMPWNNGDKPVPIIMYREARGDRYFMVRERRDKYDIRIVVQGVVTAEREQVSAKAVEMAARTLGISLTQDNLRVLLQSATKSTLLP